VNLEVVHGRFWNDTCGGYKSRGEKRRIYARLARIVKRQRKTKRIIGSNDFVVR